MSEAAPIIISFPAGPNSTTQVLPSTGITEIDFSTRGVLYPTGAGGTLLTGLQGSAFESMQSLVIYSSQSIKIQFISTSVGNRHDGDWIEIPARARHMFNGVLFDKLKINAFVANTAISLVASTSPDASFQQFSQSIDVVNPAYTLASDPAVDFIGALILNASANANLIGLTDNTVTITGVTIVSKQNLHYELQLFKKDTFGVADFAASIDADVKAFGKLVGAFYVLDITKEEDLYIDLDSSQELHVSLVNRDPVAKIAGVPGAITLTFKYEPRK